VSIVTASIETSTRCDCGAYVTLTLREKYNWIAACPDNHAVGVGEGPDEALSDWATEHSVFEPKYVPTDMDLWIVPPKPEGYVLHSMGAIFDQLSQAHAWADATPNGPAVPIHYGPFPTLPNPTQTETL
jgi:hypothetical protein